MCIFKDNTKEKKWSNTGRPFPPNINKNLMECSMAMGTAVTFQKEGHGQLEKENLSSICLYKRLHFPFPFIFIKGEFKERKLIQHLFQEVPGKFPPCSYSKSVYVFILNLGLIVYVSEMFRYAPILLLMLTLHSLYWKPL